MKIIGIPNCAANEFAEMELCRESRRGKCLGQILKYWSHVMCLEMEEPIKQLCEWQKCNMGVKSWAMGLKEELHNNGLALVWKQQQECNLREMLRLVKESCNDIERQNILPKFPEKGSLTLYRELNFVWGKKLYIGWCVRKGRNGIAWLLAGIRQLKGVRRNIEKERFSLGLGEDDVNHVLDCEDTKHCRMKLIHDKWLKMNKEVAYRKMVKITNKAHIQNLGKHLDIEKIKLLNKKEEM
jgi:hypothetical protein